MPSFTDTQGRTWNLSLPIGLHRRLKRDHDIDFTNHGTGGGISKVTSDPEQLGKAIWLMIEAQAAAAGVTEDDFADAMDGDAAAEATEALGEAIVNFSPPHRRDALKRLMARRIEMEVMSAEEMVKRLEGEETEKLIRKGTRDEYDRLAKKLTRS